MLARCFSYMNEAAAKSAEAVEAVVWDAEADAEAAEAAAEADAWDAEAVVWDAEAKIN